MDFIDQVKQFTKRVEGIKDNISTEEATKTSIIMPFFALLGYDVFNPAEFVPEFTADVGIKKGEKVDYAIILNDEPAILIEAKWIGEKLDKHDSQLFRYFGTTNAKFAILTNGRYYRFYTDLEEPNKMDEIPFLEIDILDIKESQVAELKKFHRDSFNLAEIFDAAAELKYSNAFKIKLNDQLSEPTDEFVRLFLSGCYDGVKTQTVVDRFRPVLKKSLNDYINEKMSDKIKTALGTTDVVIPSVTPAQAEESIVEAPAKEKDKIITTEEELEAFFIVKNLLKEFAPISDFHFKDNIRYSAVLYKNKTTKWICRFYLSDNRKVISIPDSSKAEIKYTLSNVYDIEQYKDQLLAALKNFL